MMGTFDFMNTSDYPIPGGSKEDVDDLLHKEYDYIIQKYDYQEEQIVGGYLVAYSVSHAKNMNFQKNGAIGWDQIKNENAHIGIAIHDAVDLHFIHGLKVFVVVMDAKGYLIGDCEHPFFEQPQLQYYGRNWELPGDGKYALHVRIDTPIPMQFDEVNQRSYPGIVTVEFKNVKINTGQDIS